MFDLSAALGIVVDVLESIGADYVVVGSTAAAAWGVARATRDVDLVTAIDSVQLDEVIAGLRRPDLYVPEEDARSAALGGSFNVLHPASGGKVDVFVAPRADRFTRSRVQRRVSAVVFGVETWVATPEDVVLAKLRWRLESRSEVQWRDCVEIAAVQHLDVEYLRSWAAELNVMADLDELLDQATGR